MIKTHAFLYFGSRLSAAVANLAAVAIFTRLAGSEVYGGSILVFSWGFVVFGFCGQWLGAAFFAIYRPEEAGRQVATLARLAIAATGTAGLATAMVVSLGFTTWGFGATVFTTVLGLMLFVTVTEAERTRLDAGWVAIMYIARAALIITLGSLVLLLGGGSLALASALAGANVIAALPGLFRIGRSLAAPPDRATANEFLNYGWPLVIAFGAMALGQNIDRLILVHVAGIGELGAYGATSDFLKQGFGVVCEAITLASVSVAKEAATRGDDAKTRLVLEDAFRAVTATVAFGVVFMTTFSTDIVDVIFGPDYRVAARAVMPWLIGANAALVLRAFYFGQAIYFGQSSRNEAVASLSMIVVTAVLGFTLIPRFGVYGAAVAATGGQLAACAVFVASRPRMPIPAASAISIWGVAAATLALTTLVDHFSSGNSTENGIIKLLALVAAGLGVVWRHDILGLRDVAKGLAHGWLNQGTKDENATHPADHSRR
jgi:O-antigen/teichoic acid export membrane protein